MEPQLVLLYGGHQYLLTIHPDDTVTGERIVAPTSPQDRTIINMGEISRAIPLEVASKATVSRAYWLIIRAAESGRGFFARWVVASRRGKTISLLTLQDAMRQPEFDEEYLDLLNAGPKSLAALRDTMPILCQQRGIPYPH